MWRAVLVGLMGIGVAGCGDAGPAAIPVTPPAAAAVTEATTRYEKARAYAERDEAEARAEWRRQGAPVADELAPDPDPGEEPFASKRVAAAWVGAAQAALDAGNPAATRDCWTRAIGCDPDCPEARRGLGHVRYALPDGEPWDTLAIEGLVEALDRQVGEWVAPERLATLQVEEARLRPLGEAELARRAEDPGYATRCQLGRQVRAHEGFAGRRFEEAWVAPFLVLRESHPAEPAGRWIPRVVASLGSAVSRFRAVAAEVTGAAVEIRGPFAVVLLRDGEALDAYTKAASLGTRPGLEGLFHISPCWTVCRECAPEPGAPSAPDLGLIRLAIYQLSDAWMNAGRGDGSRVDPSLWITYGFAGWLTGGRGDAAQLDAETVETLRALRRHDDRTGTRVGDTPTSRTRLSSIPGVVSISGWRGLADVQRFLVASQSDPVLRYRIVKELAPAYLRAHATAFFHFCHGRPALWRRLCEHISWEWGRNPADQPPTRTSLRAWASEPATALDSPHSPVARCAAAFARAFDGVDMAALDADFAAWVGAQLAAADGSPTPAEGGR